MQFTGITSLITLISHLFFVSIAFWSVQNIHIEKYLPMRAMPGKLLIVLISITLGFTCSNFFLSIINNIHNLGFLIK